MESDDDSEISIGSDDSSRHNESESDSEDETNKEFNKNLQLAIGNNPDITELNGYGDNERIHNFTDEEWVDIGRALSKNTHLKTLRMIALNDHQLSLLFSGLTRSSSIHNLRLRYNGLRTGIKSMLPFLQNANNLVKLNLDHNNIQSEEFNFLLVALCDSPITLEELNLYENRINEDGCRGIAKLLKKPDCALQYLELSHNEVNDTGIAALVDALQNNTSLNFLNLSENNGISMEGEIMILKLVNDISSVKATLQSNHTLRTIYLSNGHTELGEQIIVSLRINRHYTNDAEAARREKMIQFQLHSEIRSALAKLQNVDHSLVYSEINPLHLPEVLSLVGHRHGQGELFAAVKSSIVALMSTVNRKKWMIEAREYHLAKAAQFTAEIAAIEAEEEDGTEVVGAESRESKRRR